MWLEQKIYTFKAEKGAVNQEDILGNIYLQVNENLTTVKLEQLFTKINSWEFDEDSKLLEVKGWSMLQNVEPVTGELILKEAIVKISFNSGELGNLNIIKIKDPLVILNDKEITDEVAERFNDKIVELSQVKTADNETEESGKPHPESSVVNKKYEIGKARYLANGYKELIDKNFKLLIKEPATAGGDEKKIVLLFNVISEDEIEQFSNPIASEIADFYQFVDEKNNKKLNAKIIDGVLNVEVIEGN